MVLLVLTLSGCIDRKEEEARTVRYELYYVADSSEVVDKARAGGGLTFFTYRASSETEYEIDLRLYNKDGGLVRRTIENKTALNKLVVYFIEEYEQPYIELDYEAYDVDYLVNEMQINSYAVNEIRLYVHEKDYVRNEISLNN